MLRVASWNVNSLKVRLPQVLEWINNYQPDLFALQETKLIDEQFPRSEIEETGYKVIYSGQKTYNGVAILSKKKPKDVLSEFPNFDDPQRRVLAATYNNVRMINLYIPNGGSVDSDKYEYKLRWLKTLNTFLKTELKKYPSIIVLGDFNIAPEDQDVYDPDAWRGEVLCSEPERAAFQTLIHQGFVDTFRLFEQPDRSYTWWDYRQMRFRRKQGLRIDHILVNQSLANKCALSSIDIEPRRHERPSDHAPVFAEFDL